MNKLWKLPLLQRVLKASWPGWKEKLMELDDVGFFYQYNKKEDLEPTFIRRHMQLRQDTWAILEAPTITQAINTFYNEWDGAKVGGKAEEAKALWVDREKPIREIASCQLLHKNKKGQFICGVESTNGNGDFGMCVLENYDRPEGICEIGIYYDKIYFLESNKLLPIKTIIIKDKEYKYYTVKDVETAYELFYNSRQKELEDLPKPSILEVINK